MLDEWLSGLDASGIEGGMSVVRSWAAGGSRSSSSNMS